MSGYIGFASPFGVGGAAEFIQLQEMTALALAEQAKRTAGQRLREEGQRRATQVFHEGQEFVQQHVAGGGGGGGGIPVALEHKGLEQLGTAGRAVGIGVAVLGAALVAYGLLKR